MQPVGSPVQEGGRVVRDDERAAEPELVVDASGRKWLTPNIPYDVFEGLPPADEIAASAVASQRGGEVNSGTMVPRDSAPVEPVASGKEVVSSSSSARPMSDSGGETGWNEVLPLDALQAEIAAVRNRLGERLLTVGTYNGAFEEVAGAGWEMSALATIVSEHPSSISWKDQALHARDAAVGIAMAASGRGRENFSTAQLASEQLFAIQNNNSPAGLGEPDPDAPREETADRAALMRRMQSAFDRLKEVGSGEALQAEPEQAIHEARILAALMKFTADADYTAAENDDYQAAAMEIVSGGGSLSRAAESGDVAAFQSALDRINNACNQCHTKYRFAN